MIKKKQRLLLSLMPLLWTTYASCQSERPPKPLTVSGIRRWQHRGGLKGWSNWPKEIQLDICGDSRRELFLAVGGFSRGLTYAVFARRGKSWKILGDNIDCTAGMVDVLSAEHHGYHDVAAFQRSGRGGFLVRVYSWNGHRYSEKANWEMTHDQLYGTK